ncbi:MAG: diaminopimelate decarboxylase [Deltaproteobacteria bacterium]|nr:diaminopimelate decarboxylase [Deltaproteobacteria bacterium]
MRSFEYIDEEMFCEDVSLTKIAEEIGTPVYVYSKSALAGRFRRIMGAWPEGRRPTIAYAMRANFGKALLGVLNAEDAWVSIQSGGELMQAFKAGFSPGRIIFSGMGRSDDEVRLALTKEIYLVVADSRSELDRISRLATEAGTPTRTAIRVHPLAGREPGKIGIPLIQAEEVIRHAADTDGLEVVGIHHYIGRYFPEEEPFLEALRSTLELVDRLAAAGVMLTVLDIGGTAGELFLNRAFCLQVAEAVGTRPMRIVLEPGRSLVATAGVLLTRVQGLKETADKRYIVADAAMNDMMTPALFQWYHDIRPVRNFEPPDAPLYDVVGPMFEAVDHLGRNRPLAGVVPGDLLAVMDAGAYGSAMACNYAMRPRPAEVMVDGESFRLVRRRETFQDIVRTEMDVG